MNRYDGMLINIHIRTDKINIRLNMYLMNNTASPASNLFALTKTLHPVVRRCLRGWPAQDNKTASIYLIDHSSILCAIPWKAFEEKSIKWAFFTSINMAEMPILVMKIPSNKLLGRRLLCVILQGPIIPMSLSTESIPMSESLAIQKFVQTHTYDQAGGWYQRGENFLGSTSRYWEATMGTSITGS